MSERELEIDQLLRDFQRACETVIWQGDKVLPSITAHRALLRNELRKQLLDASSLTARAVRAERVLTSLRDAANECADDLEAELRNRYGYPNVHPAMQGKYDRDMEPVLAVRAAKDQWAEYDALVADTKRLDWLERMAHDGDRIGDIVIGGSWVSQVVYVGDPEVTNIRGEGPTVREAIDAASAPRPATP